VALLSPPNLDSDASKYRRRIDFGQLR